MKNMEKN